MNKSNTKGNKVFFGRFIRFAKNGGNFIILLFRHYIEKPQCIETKHAIICGDLLEEA